MRPTEVAREPDPERLHRALLRLYMSALEAGRQLERQRQMVEAGQGEAPARAGNLAAGAVEVEGSCEPPTT